MARVSGPFALQWKTIAFVADVFRRDSSHIAFERRDDLEKTTPESRCGLTTPAWRVLRDSADVELCLTFPTPYVLKPLADTRKGVDTVVEILSAGDFKTGTVSYTMAPFDLGVEAGLTVDEFTDLL